VPATIIVASTIYILHICSPPSKYRPTGDQTRIIPRSVETNDHVIAFLDSSRPSRVRVRAFWSTGMVPPVAPPPPRCSTFSLILSSDMSRDRICSSSPSGAAASLR
jgi:hypothetical protein